MLNLLGLFLEKLVLKIKKVLIKYLNLLRKLLGLLFFGKKNKRNNLLVKVFSRMIVMIKKIKRNVVKIENIRQ